MEALRLVKGINVYFGSRGLINGIHDTCPLHLIGEPHALSVRGAMREILALPYEV